MVYISLAGLIVINGILRILEKKRSQSSDINKARSQFDEQASTLSQQDVRIKAFVINMALH